MRVLLVSTYELGHQPLQVASPAAALAAAGHEVAAIDLAVEDWDQDRFDWAQVVAFSVPMHTAMRLAVEAASRLRSARPLVPICIYGLYACVSADHVTAGVADLVIAGEYEQELLDWVDSAAERRPDTAGRARVALSRGHFRVPRRDVLPGLERYAHLEVGGERRLAGYVELTHGCTQRCRHCPVPAVYDGRIRVVDETAVLEDIARLAGSGVQHVTIGDPDFLCGPKHTIAVMSKIHASYPDLTFDVTSKISHVLAHRGIWPELAAMGLLFVTSAVECLDEKILELLDKGHTGAQADEAVELLAAAGVDMHPSFLPFTPWTTAATVAAILHFVRRHGLVGLVDPVQYSLRLLIPEGSLLLDEAELSPFLGDYDPARFTWTWRAADPRIDLLQSEIAALVESHAAEGRPPAETFAGVEALVVEAAGAHLDHGAPAEAALAEPCGRPRLTESWFCCAEPTSAQQHAVRVGGSRSPV